jgi:hypothetical protein
MAPPKHVSGVKLVLKVGDGQSPEVFTPKCSINTQRGISFNGNDSEFEIPDCDDPEKIAWIARERKANSVTVTGAGTLDARDLAAFFTWYKTGATINCQMVVDVPSSDGGVIFEGGYKMTFEVTGERGGKVEISVTLNSDGEITSAANT